MTRVAVFAILATFVTLSACGNAHNRINGGVSIKSGETAENISTVNGGIHVESNGTVREVETVNGSIDLENGAKADSLETVNGGIMLGAGAHVAHDVETVNGSISLGEQAKVAGDVTAVNGDMSLAKAADVAGEVENVNGRIQLTAAHVGGGIETVGGNIDVGANSRVEGGIVVRKPKGVSVGKKIVPRIVIGPGAVVEGTLKFEREVKLYVSESAKVGAIEGAKAEKFAGDQPPG